MSVVSNAGPLIALSRIEQLALLPQLYGQVAIPGAVYAEISRDETMPGASELIQAEWLQTIAVKDQFEVERLRFWLDLGESEAIVLARERRCLLLIDERRGRNIALSFDIRQTGTVGVLLAAKRQSLISEVTPLLNALIAARVRISTRLYDEVRALAQEL